jgi:hypothetical protein
MKYLLFIENSKLSVIEYFSPKKSKQKAKKNHPKTLNFEYIFDMDVG